VYRLQGPRGHPGTALAALASEEDIGVDMALPGEQDVPVAADAPPPGERLLHPGLRVPFVLLVLCFAAWGAAANLTDILVGVFRGIFDMSNLQSTLVQSAYYGAYFALAIPAAFVNRRFGYKAGVLTGLGLATVGGVLFLPASQLLAYEAFLLALFVLAAGLSILETSANPFVIAMGPEASATQRLNLAQAFNPVGANIGVLLGAVLILPRLTPEAEKLIMTPIELESSLQADLQLVLVPYLGIAAVLASIWVLIYKRDMVVAEAPAALAAVVPVTTAPSGAVASRLWRNRRYRFGVVAQFFNVGAQVCAWTFTILYAQDVVGVAPGTAGWYLQASLIVFLVSRFVMTYLLGKVSPPGLLAVMATLGVVLCVIAMFSLNLVGLLAVVGISLSLSLMFPTIYGLALQGLGEDAKFGAAGLVMAILGGAIMPMVQGAVMDQVGAALAFAVPAVCLAVVAAYGLAELRSGPGRDAAADAGSEVAP
jgi:MFS transporter, FHS family, L-fucose permease